MARKIAPGQNFSILVLCYFCNYHSRAHSWTTSKLFRQDIVPDQNDFSLPLPVIVIDCGYIIIDIKVSSRFPTKRFMANQWRKKLKIVTKQECPHSQKHWPTQDYLTRKKKDNSCNQFSPCPSNYSWFPQEILDAVSLELDVVGFLCWNNGENDMFSTTCSG